MYPYLKENRLVLVLVSKNYKIGDVIGFRFDNQVYIKRISKIKDKMLFVLGDNPDNSLDSRKFGWISKGSVEFKLIFKF